MHPLRCLVLAAACLLPASAQQFTLLDGTFEYTSDGHIGDKAPTQRPESWLTPHDYAHGTAYIRVEVLEKANSTTPINFLCRILSGPHADRQQNTRLGFRSVLFTHTGRAVFTVPVQDMKPLVEPSTFRWDSPVTYVQPVVADANGQMVSRWEHDLGAFTGEMASYFPLKLRCTAIIVAKGAKFTPPPGWE